MAQHDLIQARFRISELEEDLVESESIIEIVRKNFTTLKDFCAKSGLDIPRDLYTNKVFGVD